MFRGWSRLCLHSASLETAEAISATETVAERLSRSEVETRKTAAALRKRAEVAERGERDQQQKRAMHLVRNLSRIDGLSDTYINVYSRVRAR